MSDKIRCRNFDLLLYDEDPTHQSCLEKLATGYKYIAIKHDKDIWTDDDNIPEGCKVGDLKKAHWHVIIKFPQARWNTAVASELGISLNYIQRCVSYDGSLLYLVHRGMPHKHQYDPSECIGTLKKDLEKALDNETDLNERVLDVLDILDERPHWTTRAFLIEACNRKRIGEAMRLGGLLTAVLSEHNQEFQYQLDLDHARKVGFVADRATFERFIRYESQGINFDEMITRLNRQGYKFPETPME